MSKQIGVAIIGLGTVGSGLYTILQQNQDIINQKAETKIAVRAVMDLDITKIEALKIDKELIFNKVEDICRSENIDIVVELIGGENPAKAIIEDALKAKKHVVTANKEVIAKHGTALLKLAEKNRVNLFYEASVGGGIPIIHPLKYCLGANRITQIMGILNGTTNYILTKMTSEGADYSEVLAEAQKLGYAEADPTADVEGYDAAYKISILASIAFASKVKFTDVRREGISKIAGQDIKYAKEIGCVIKLLAIARERDGQIEAMVQPTIIPLTHPLAKVDGVFNALYVYGDAVGEVMFYGPGAGMMATGSAVAADVMEIARGISNNHEPSLQCSCFFDKAILNPEIGESSYYLRMLVDDKPGVLAAIAKTFGDHGVSILSVIQKDITEDKGAEIVWITEIVAQKNFDSALVDLNNLNSIREIASIIKVEK
jgi:homoserine dehydrogenase